MSELYFPEYDEYFRPISNVITAFSQKHGLILEKYIHESPTWGLCFQHPLGGQAMININRLDNDNLGILASWWMDDYKTFSRSARTLIHKRVKKEAGVVEKTLGVTLDTVLAWQIGQWDNVATGYEEHWGEFSQEEFEAMIPVWPVPR